MKWSYNLLNDNHNTLWSLITCYLRSAILGNTKKKFTKIVFHRENSINFEKVFQTTFLVRKKSSLNLPNNCQKTLCTLINCSLTSVLLHNTRNLAEIIFSPEKKPFFENLFPTTSKVLQKSTYILRSDYHITLWSLMKCYLRSAILGNTRKNSPKLSFIGKISFFLRKFFKRPRRS